MISENSPTAFLKRQRFVFVQAPLKILIVLGSCHKKIFLARRQSSQHPEISFLIASQIIVSAVSHAATAIGMINNVGKNVFGIIHTHSKNGTFFYRNIGFVIFGKL